MNSTEVIATHRAAGRFFTAGAVRSFVLDEGEGPAVVCLHGVPTSSFLYRKVVPELALRHLRGIAFDLPGLGLADRPTELDYSWSGLGAWAATAIDALELERVHLVVHDIGGPVGFEAARRLGSRVESMTVLNTVIEADTFRRPWTMHPFSVPRVGEAWLAGMVKPLFRRLMALQGVHDMSAVPNAELDAYVDLLKREDGGRAFLRIMRGFELTREKRDAYVGLLGSGAFDVQVVWGEHDPALPLATHGEAARRATGVEHVSLLPGKHFLQEDNAPAIAELVRALVRG